MSLSYLQGFHVNDKVLASWSDCRFYPAKVISVNKDGGYQLPDVYWVCRCIVLNRNEYSVAYGLMYYKLMTEKLICIFGLLKLVRFKQDKIMLQVLIIKQPPLIPKRKFCWYIEHAFQFVLLYSPQHPTLSSSMMASSRKWREYTLSHLLNRYMSVIYLFLVFFVQSVFWGWSSAWGIFF